MWQVATKKKGKFDSNNLGQTCFQITPHLKESSSVDELPPGYDLIRDECRVFETASPHTVCPCDIVATCVSSSYGPQSAHSEAICHSFGGEADGVPVVQLGSTLQPSGNVSLLQPLKPDPHSHPYT